MIVERARPLTRRGVQTLMHVSDAADFADGSSIAWGTGLGALAGWLVLGKPLIGAGLGALLGYLKR